MGKLNKIADRAGRSSAVKSTTPDVTALGGTGFAREAQGELFLLAVGNFVAETTFHEDPDERDDRFARLVVSVAEQDPAWVTGFFPWLRTEGFMRSASVVGAAEAAKALCDLNRYDGVTRMVDGSLQRPDEIGEFVAYWFSIAGRSHKGRYDAVYDGLKLAIGRMFTERNWLKYDSAKTGFRFADLISIVHPAPVDERQRTLFKHILDHYYKKDQAPVPDSLTMIREARAWRAEVHRLTGGSMPTSAQDEALGGLLSPDRLKRAGMTWEDVLSSLGSKVDKATLWQSIYPSMGAMALIRNLRNFDEADVPDVTAEAIGKIFSDPEQAKRSKQFPFRYLAAYKSVKTLRWGHYLEQALNHSLVNVPALGGRTLVLVDRSGSMFHSHMSGRSELTLADAAAIFGSALALRAENAKLVQFGTRHEEVKFSRNEALLRMLGKFTDLGGTNTAEAVHHHYDKHDRVVIVTDEQAGYSHYGDPTEQVPAHVPVYTWNLAGYRVGHGKSGSGNRHTFGGLSDSAFRLIPALERKRDAKWPWMT